MARKSRSRPRRRRRDLGGLDLSGKQKLLLGIGALALTVLLLTQSGKVIGVGKMLLDDAQSAIFKSVIPWQARPYADVILRVSSETGVSPFVIVALGMRETQWGNTPDLSEPGPAGTGDSGHGRGLMQIDDRSWGDWLENNDWTDPYTNVSKGVAIYLTGRHYLEQHGVTGEMLDKGAIAAYNEGPGKVLRLINEGQDPSAGTTGGDYATDVLGKIASYVASFNQQGGATV